MSKRTMQRILVTGAVGQIGSELTLALRQRYGSSNVVAAGHRTLPSPQLRDSGPFAFIDVTQKASLEEAILEYDIDTVYHMAAILSAVGEAKPQLCWDVNMNGLYNLLEIAREEKLYRLFCPSSIAAFGPDTPRVDTPQETVLRPKTMYGVTKVAGELLCDYYFSRFGVDVHLLALAFAIVCLKVVKELLAPGSGPEDRLTFLCAHQISPLLLLPVTAPFLLCYIPLE